MSGGLVEREAGVKLHKVVNRKYRGKTYYRWILMVPPKLVGELGWREGAEIAMEVRGHTLRVHPAMDDRSIDRAPSGRSR